MSAQKEEEPFKVDKWDGNALKNALDDAAKKVLNDSYGLVESFRLMDGRLALCSLAVCCSLFALLWDYLHPYPASRAVLIACVTSYFALTGVISVYLLFVEGGTFYVGLEKDKVGIDPDDRWTLSSSLRRFDDQYTLKMTFVSGTTGEFRSGERTFSVTKFFDEEGTLCQEDYEAAIKDMRCGLAEKKSQ